MTLFETKPRKLLTNRGGGGGKIVIKHLVVVQFRKNGGQSSGTGAFLM